MVLTSANSFRHLTSARQMVRGHSSAAREDGKDGHRVNLTMRMAPDLTSQEVSIYEPLQEKLSMIPSDARRALLLEKGRHVTAASVELRGVNRFIVLFFVVYCIYHHRVWRYHPYFHVSAACPHPSRGRESRSATG